MDNEPNPYPLVYVSDSPMIPVYRTLEKVLDSSATVLIEGESGAGKDALAQWLHYSGTRKHTPFVKIDLGSLPEELVESELFGYERGAFTGAVHAKAGKLDLAQGGTIVLDEVANVDLRVQTKLLHVVEAKQFSRLGGTRSIRLDCRIIALSAHPLADAVERKTFREDLFFRLNLITVRVPSLRERATEIFPMAVDLLRHLSRKYNAPATLDPACATVFSNYDFPGNIRELRNGLERGLLLGSDGRITPESLPVSWIGKNAFDGKFPTLEEVERRHIAEVLKQTRGKKIKAARILGISRKTLLEKRKRYGLP